MCTSYYAIIINSVSNTRVKVQQLATTEGKLPKVVAKITAKVNIYKGVKVLMKANSVVAKVLHWALVF